MTEQVYKPNGALVPIGEVDTDNVFILIGGGRGPTPSPGLRIQDDGEGGTKIVSSNKGGRPLQQGDAVEIPASLKEIWGPFKTRFMLRATFISLRDESTSPEARARAMQRQPFTPIELQNVGW